MNNTAETASPWQAILLVGPTGSGKTPLGEILEKRGLWDTKCLHFDFGETLRNSVVRQNTPLNREEISAVRALLRANALLNDEQFPIAAKLMQDFLTRRQARYYDLLVLNGLPRHTGQARDMDGYVKMLAVVNLQCSPYVVKDRIKKNTGGDRRRRVDDSILEVEKKLRIYNEQNDPLVAFYRAKKTPVICIEVERESSARDMLAFLEENKPEIV
jgi:adenylate kinase